MKINILTAFKGMLVGGTMLVPGVSGGSMAMILGIYNQLIASISSFIKNKKKNAIFLLLFLVGSGLGMALFAKPLLALIEQYPKPTLYFFIGAVAGGVPLIFKQSGVKKFSFKVPLYVIVGIIVVLLFSMIPTGTFQSKMETGVVSFLLLTLAGFIAAIALVLPGISVSYMLLLMGLYDETMRAISEFYLPFLAPLCIGLILGIVLTTKFLERIMTNHPQSTYLIILGFVLGSIVQIFPGIPMGAELFLCIATLAVGFGAIRLLSVKEMRNL